MLSISQFRASHPVSEVRKIPANSAFVYYRMHTTLKYISIRALNSKKLKE